MKTAGTAGIQKFARMRSPHREGPGGAIANPAVLPP